MTDTTRLLPDLVSTGNIQANHGSVIWTDAPEKESSKSSDRSEKGRKYLRNAIFLSFVMGSLFMVAVKALALWYSNGCQAIKVSMFESVGDSLCQSVFIFTYFSASQVKKYPKGILLLEATATLIFAVFMITMMLQGIIDNLQEVIDLLLGRTDNDELYRSILGPFSESDAFDLVYAQDMSYTNYIVMSAALGTVFLTKATLFFVVKYVYYSKYQNPITKALFQDHIQDCVTNLLVQCAVHSKYWITSFYGNRYARQLQYVDPCITITLSCWILSNWVETGLEQRLAIVGRTAPPGYVEQVLVEVQKAGLRKPQKICIFTKGRKFDIEMEFLVANQKDLLAEMTLSKQIVKRLKLMDDFDNVYVDFDIINDKMRTSDV